MNCICGSCFAESVGESGICTACGYDNAKNREEFPLALPAGSILYGQYIIGRVLGQGGFGITYLAQDYQTKELVAIKEFFPGSMATRTGTTVIPYSGIQGENFTYGKNTFLDEAQTMAEFNGNPNIAGVQLYFEENGTAYFVMEYLDGQNFGDYIASRGGKLSWAYTAKIMLPVLEVLGQLHEKGVIHRDIAPDNIFITKDGTVKLLDFGAARHSLGNVSQSLDVVIKHGFAPKEQYSRRGRQGPYTDVYAASATIYYALTGAKPDDAIERSTEDTMPLPSNLGAKISPLLESVLMKGMAIETADRYQTMGDLHKALTTMPVTTDRRKPEPISDPVTDPVSKEKERDPRNNIGLTVLCVGAVLALVLLIMVNKDKGKQMQNNDTQLATTFKESYDKVKEQGETDQQTPAPNSVYMATEATSANLMIESTYPVEEIGFWGQTVYNRSEIQKIFFLNTQKNAPASAWDISAAQDGSVKAWVEGEEWRYVVYVASNGKVVANPNSSGLFAQFNNLREISFNQNFDTSRVTDMSFLFCNSFCDGDKGLDLSCFDTSNVENMSYMFAWCDLPLLEDLNLSGFDTSKVTDMSAMFFGTTISTLDLSTFDTSNVTDMSAMFSNCWLLNELNIENFRTSEKTNVENIFYHCSQPSKLICSDERLLSEYDSEYDC